MTVWILLRGQLAFMREHAFDVTVISAPGPQLERAAEREQVRHISAPLCRRAHALHDLRALVKLVRTFKAERPDIVNASTPKAGLLAMLAARMTGVPVRIFTLRGLRSEGASGLTRWMLENVESVPARLAHRVICVSDSLMRRAEERGVVPRGRSVVLGSGSSNGVCSSRFSGIPDADRLRAGLGIPTGARVIGFAGRLTGDKGVRDLLAAVDRVASIQPSCHLLLVGDFERGREFSAEERRRIKEQPRVTVTGFVDDPAPYYSLMNVFAFPSAREGFPNAPLEAAAAGLPVVAFAATGTVDAVIDGVTGTLVECGNVAALAHGIARYLADDELARSHGAAGQRRVLLEFRPDKVWEAMRREYLTLLGRSRGQVLAAAADGRRPRQG